HSWLGSCHFREYVQHPNLLDKMVGLGQPSRILLQSVVPWRGWKLERINDVVQIYVLLPYLDGIIAGELANQKGFAAAPHHAQGPPDERAVIAEQRFIGGAIGHSEPDHQDVALLGNNQRRSIRVQFDAFHTSMSASARRD